METGADVEQRCLIQFLWYLVKGPFNQTLCPAKPVGLSGSFIASEMLFAVIRPYGKKIALKEVQQWLLERSS